MQDIVYRRITLFSEENFQGKAVTYDDGDLEKMTGQFLVISHPSIPDGDVKSLIVSGHERWAVCLHEDSNTPNGSVSNSGGPNVDGGYPDPSHWMKLHKKYIAPNIRSLQRG